MDKSGLIISIEILHSNIIFAFSGTNPDISYPIWYKAIRPLWCSLGLAWVAMIIGAKTDFMQKILNKRDLNEIVHLEDKQVCKITGIV